MGQRREGGGGWLGRQASLGAVSGMLLAGRRPMTAKEGEGVMAASTTLVVGARVAGLVVVLGVVGGVFESGATHVMQVGKKHA